MAVRPIDANAMLNELRPVNFEAEHSAVLLSDVSKMMREWVERQPTLTQPNESATDTNVGGKDNDVSTNEPLMLEVLATSQLLQMLGEKVEVIRMGKMCQAEWATVRSFGDCKTDSGCPCCHELYGKTWIAYRRPPEGEEETEK